jgi:hypothetical protein
MEPIILLAILLTIPLNIFVLVAVGKLFSIRIQSPANWHHPNRVDCLAWLTRSR